MKPIKALRDNVVKAAMRAYKVLHTKGAHITDIINTGELRDIACAALKKRVKKK